MEPALSVVDVQQDIIDRIFVVEEFPTVGTVLNPTDWEDKPEKYGLPKSKDKVLISDERKSNISNRRKALDVRRSVMTILPKVQWGGEFTRRFSAPGYR